MSWLKHVIVDLAITAVIILYALQGPEWAWWILVIYTPLLIVLKLLAMSSGVAGAVKAKGGNEPPDWFFHVIYAVSVLLLLRADDYLLAAGWAVIWILSAVGLARSRPSKSRSTKSNAAKK
ncbi:MAG: hypothetical protein RIE53_13750 [Rhodothermales bacterium]